MDRITPLLVGLGFCFVVWRMLVTGSAGADGKSLSRDDLPAVFWGSVAVGFVAACALFYTAWRG